jgi:1-deoxy-D-xylulose 5-phosphate reductoisomerase
MRSVKELRRKAASRASRKARVYSTSEARANFAEALETAQVDNAVIGFDRYGRTIAALVPVEAIYMLAGKASMIAPGVREEIEAFSKQFVQSVPSRVGVAEQAPSAKKGVKKAPKKKPTVKRGPKGRGG